LAIRLGKEHVNVFQLGKEATGSSQAGGGSEILVLWSLFAKNERGEKGGEKRVILRGKGEQLQEIVRGGRGEGTLGRVGLAFFGRKKTQRGGKEKKETGVERRWGGLILVETRGREGTRLRRWAIAPF